MTTRQSIIRWKSTKSTCQGISCSTIWCGCVCCHWRRGWRFSIRKSYKKQKQVEASIFKLECEVTFVADFRPECTLQRWKWNFSFESLWEFERACWVSWTKASNVLTLNCQQQSVVNTSKSWIDEQESWKTLRWWRSHWRRWCWRGRWRSL